MVWLNLFNRYTLFWSRVLNVLDKTTERPHMMPLSMWQSGGYNLVVCVAEVSASPPAYSRRASDVSEAVAP